MPLSSHRDFEAALAFAASSTEHTMDRLLPKGDSDEARVFEAMRYSSLGGGKRLRAFSCWPAQRCSRSLRCRLFGPQAPSNSCTPIR
jgi:geranylgeranyl pyrophosphate synthase